MAELTRLEKLKLLLRDEAAKYTDSELELQLSLAIAAINNRRGFTPTDELDIEAKYESLLLQLAVASVNKIGAEGQTAHGEVGITRAYGNDGVYPTALLNSVIPLVGAKVRS